MKEDILVQIGDDYYSNQPGIFTKCNLKYRPDKTHNDYLVNAYSVNSDIDILAVKTNAQGECIVINCKSWQSRVNIKKVHNAVKKAIHEQPMKSLGEHIGVTSENYVLRNGRSLFWLEYKMRLILMLPKLNSLFFVQNFQRRNLKKIKLQLKLVKLLKHIFKNLELI